MSPKLINGAVNSTCILVIAIGLTRYFRGPFNLNSLGPGDWGFIVSSSIAFLYVLYNIISKFIRSRMSRSRGDFDAIWNEIFDNLKGIVDIESTDAHPEPAEFNSSLRFGLFPIGRRYVFFKLYASANHTHIVDYQYYRIMSILREKLEFRPVVLVTDVQAAYHAEKNILEPNAKMEAVRETVKKEIITHLGKGVTIHFMSQISRSLIHAPKLKGTCIVPLAKEMVTDLTKQIRVQEDVMLTGTELESSYIRFATALFWLSFINERYGKADLALLLQWRAKIDLYGVFSRQKTRYIALVKNATIGGQNAKLTPEGKALTLQPSTRETNRSGFKGVSDWIINNWGDHERMHDIEQIAELLRCDPNMDRAIATYKPCHYPADKDNIFLQYFSAALQKGEDSDDETRWRNIAQLIAKEFADIDKRAFE